MKGGSLHAVRVALKCTYAEANHLPNPNAYLPKKG